MSSSLMASRPETVRNRGILKKFDCVAHKFVRIHVSSPPRLDHSGAYVESMELSRSADESPPHTPSLVGHSSHYSTHRSRLDAILARRCCRMLSRKLSVSSQSHQHFPFLLLSIPALSSCDDYSTVSSLSPCYPYLTIRVPSVFNATLNVLSLCTRAISDESNIYCYDTQSSEIVARPSYSL